MVRIVELFEAEDLKPLKPGEASHISGIDPDLQTLKILNKIDQHQDTYNSTSLDTHLNHKWVNGKSVLKTQAEKDAEEEQLRLSKNEMNARSLAFVRDLKQAIPYIEKNCSKFLPILHNNGFLYRGFKLNDLPHAVFYGYPRKDRLPRDSNADLQKMFDEALDMEGIVAKRSNSLFVTGQKRQAEAYGLPFIIFPCNDVHYAWSKRVHDIILDKHNQPEFLQLVGEYDNHHIDEYEYVGQFQKLFGIVQDEIEQAMKQKHEIWLTGHYVAVLATLEPQLRKLIFG